MKSRTMTGLVAAVAVVAGTAGCSAVAVTQKAAGESAETVVQALSHVSDEASKAGSAEISATMAGPATGGKAVTMKGLYSWGDGGLAMETTMPAEDAQMTHLVKDGGTVTVRLVNGSYYYGVDPIESGPYAGKSWLKVEASAIVGEKGAAGMAQGQGDPTAGLKGLKYAKDTAWVGVETVNGKNTKHYRASIPAAKMGATADMPKSLGLSGDVVMDVWLDEKGAPARLNQVMGETSISVDFLSFGGTKTVEVPPAADVADMTAILKEQKEGKAA
ncbi:hypothetical protein [Streptomyces sp. NPDC059708]|uniref:hypothetical protein n=1 Tax=Streptomyces sp. NPDC059708 TaxID=3346916 RepID=UPI0036CA136E